MNSQKLVSTNNIKSFDEANRIAITSITYTDASYNDLDDTAVSSSGGNIKIRGYGFLPGATIYINGSLVSNTYISGSEYRAVVPAIATGTVNLMLFNTNNYGAVYTNGVQTSGFPSFTSTTYSTTSTEINIQLLATGDAPLTYSLYSGTLPDGVTLSSSGLFSGTVTASSISSLTVLVNDAQNQTTQQNITLTVAATDVYYPYTTLSLTGESTSNSAFDDASNNRFLITKNGTPGSTPTANTPFANTWSWFVNSSTYYTTTSSASFGFAGQFTMEGWLYWIVPPSGDMNVWGVGASSGMLLYYSGGVYRANKYFVGDLVTTSYTPQANTWHHVAITRDASNLMTVWINGFSAGTATATGTFATGSWRLGDSRSNDPGGYMSNHRVVNGTCLYTANFTPPTAPLTAINNTVLLAANSNRFVDTSASPFTITQTGSVLLTNTIAPPLSLSDDQSMGSVYFDGTGYLGIATSSAFEFGTGDFTVEFWFYTSANSGLNGNSARTAALITNYGLPSAVRGWSVNLVGDASTTGTAIQFGNAINSSTEYFITYTATIAKGQWYHCAVVRSGTTTSIYLNGTSVASGTLTNQSITSSNQLRIGALDYSGAFYHRFIGLISNLRIVKGQALYTTTFTPSTTSLTTTSQSANSANVSLLTAQTKYSGNNDIFYDSSNNKLSLTRVGSVAPSTFTPYTYSPSTPNTANTWSTYFDATGDYVTVPANTKFAYGTDDFSIETWMFTTGIPAGARIISNRNSGGGLAGTWGLQFTNTQISFTQVITGEPGVTANAVVVPNTWIHIAVTRQSSNTRLFLNGTIVANAILTTNFSSTAQPIYIGQENGGTGGINAFLSNLRVVKGQAIYTANFTPSTVPLTTTSQGASAANVSLLTFQGNRLVDNSPNAYTITPTGNYSVSKFSPFPKQLEYDTTVNGGSYYFDGSGDYLTIPLNHFLPPLNTYTIECWIYPLNIPTSTLSAHLYQVSNATTTNFGALLLDLYGSGNIRFQVRPSTGGTNVLITSSSTVTTNTWSHVAVSVSAGSATLYINGASVGTGTVVVLDNTQTFSSTANLNNGYTTNVVAYNGYISDLHVVRGTALYPSSFTPPTAPITPVANTTLLLGAASANASGIIDETMMSSIDVFGSARSSTSQKKFGNSAIYFNGTTDILRMQNSGNQQFGFGTGNFTIDGWIYTTTVAAGFRTICTTRPSSATTDNFRFSFGLRAAALEFYAGSAAVISSGTVTGNTWTHFAVTRSSGSLRLFLNGTQVGSTTSFTNYLALDQQLTVGGTVAVQELWNGYIDDLRITRGYARYVANFTAPTEPNRNV